MKKQLTLTVGISTCYGSDNLLQTVKNISRSQGIKKFDFKIVANSVPLKKALLSKLVNLKVQITQNKTRGSQNKKYKQIIRLSNSDIIILTQDDVLFAPRALEKIVDAFTTDPKLTMCAARIVPLPAHGLFETLIEMGVVVTQKIAQMWRNGDNYLLANGRCLAFRLKHLKKFEIPENIVNGDAWFYLENKRRKGTFAYLKEAVVYNKSPQSVQEHLNQSSRFQYSRQEMSNYFKNDLKNEYTIPWALALKGILLAFLQNPFYALGYVCILIYTKLFRRRKEVSENPLWKVDLSTKRV